MWHVISRRSVLLVLILSIQVLRENNTLQTMLKQYLQLNYVKLQSEQALKGYPE